jgi:hypothetical protein
MIRLVICSLDACARLSKEPECGLIQVPERAVSQFQALYYQWWSEVGLNSPPQKVLSGRVGCCCVLRPTSLVYNKDVGVAVESCSRRLEAIEGSANTQWRQSGKNG